jgi:hypothetical protein
VNDDTVNLTINGVSSDGNDVVEDSVGVFSDDQDSILDFLVRASAEEGDLERFVCCTREE